MTPRMVLASCAQMPEGDGDDAGLVEALAEHGVTARWAPWGTPVADDETVVLRATWDYQDHLDRFLPWCAAQPKLINPYRAVVRNTDKTYLRRLAAAGMSVIPTTVLSPGDALTVVSDDFVIKPTIGAGSRGAGRFHTADLASARDHLEALYAQGHRALVQPYQSAVDKEGEASLVFFRGIYSHAFTKGPMLTGGPVDTAGALYLAETLTETRPEPSWVAVAEECLAAAAEDAGIGAEDLVFARVDLVRGDDGPLLLELELTEPGLGFPYVAPGPLDRFAAALSSACTQ